jgi:hypothetical protein
MPGVGFAPPAPPLRILLSAPALLHVHDSVLGAVPCLPAHAPAVLFCCARHARKSTSCSLAARDADERVRIVSRYRRWTASLGFRAPMPLSKRRSAAKAREAEKRLPPPPSPTCAREHERAAAMELSDPLSSAAAPAPADVHNGQSTIDDDHEPDWRRLDDILTTAQPFDVAGFGQVRASRALPLYTRERTHRESVHGERDRNSTNTHKPSWV